MIEYLTLVNFQGHKKITIEFDPCVTTIIGDTDEGKTSLFRAILWLAKAKSGTRIIRHGANKCRVTIGIDDGEITRTRARKHAAIFKINGEVYSAAGVSVPEAVRNILNFDDMNFQSQLDLPLWMTDSPGKVSQHLNKIVKLDTIDKTTTTAAQYVRKAKAEFEVISEQLTTTEHAISSLSWVANFEVDLARLKKTQTYLQNALESRRTLSDTISRVQTHLDRLDALRAINLHGQKLNKLIERTVSAMNKRTVLQKLIAAIETASQTIPTPPSIKPAELILKKITKVKSTLKLRKGKRTALKKEIENFNEKKRLAVKLKKELRQLHEEFKQEFNEVCPLCLRPHED